MVVRNGGNKGLSSSSLYEKAKKKEKTIVNHSANGKMAPIPSSTSISTSANPLQTLFLATLVNLEQQKIINNNTIYNNETEMSAPALRYSKPTMIVIAIVATCISILTVGGNIMVMISFKIDKQLQTISNYFLFSLAIADFAIGLISIPLFTVSTILGYWPLGPYVCDTWLALDYLASNASVLNLLIISFDRYFSVTRPLTYRAKRTTSRASLMIALAWGISLLLWPPWIYSWPYIEGKRTVPKFECYIQFIETNHYITFGTAIAAFYVPVTVMCILYFQIWGETKKRQKDLPNLQAGKKDSSKRSNSSDENAANHLPQGTMNENYGWRLPMRSESSAEIDSVYVGTTSILSDSGYTLHSRRSSTGTAGMPSTSKPCYNGIRDWCIAWWHSGREDSEDYNYDQEEPSDLGYATPVSIDTPLQCSVSRCTSLSVIKDPYAINRPPGLVSIIPDVSPTPMRQSDITGGGGTGIGGTLGNIKEGTRNSRSLSTSYNNTLTTGSGTNRLGSRSLSQDSVYTILIRLPPDGGINNEPLPSVKMISDDVPLPTILTGTTTNTTSILSSRTTTTTTTTTSSSSTTSAMSSRRPLPSRDSEYSLPIARRLSHVPDIRIPLNAKVIPKTLVKTNPMPRQAKKKKKSQEKKQESKAAKTLSAILLSFILTWTPYNILVLVKPLTCQKCIPQELWDFFYALCYINSTINPVCYALCNASFRRTYVRILTCKWHTRNREAMTRGVYN